MSDFNLSRWAVSHRAFVLFLILASGAAGVRAYFQLGRAEDPPFTIKAMVVTADWPGATADEMQRLVADPLEEKLQETPHLDFLDTYCLPGKAVVQVLLKDTTPASAVADSWYQVRKKVGDIRHQLPEGIRGPFLDDEYGDVYSAIFAFTGTDYWPAELKRLAESARQRLLCLPDVDKVVLVGEQPEKIFVEFSHKRLATLGISPRQLFESIQRQNAMFSAGTVETQTDRVQLRVEGSFDAAQRIRDVPVVVGDRLLRVGELAEIRRGHEDPPTFLMRHNGQPAVGLAVAMRAGGDVLQLGENLDAEWARLQDDLPAGAEIHKVAFQPGVVEESVGEFLHAFLEALLIVLGVSFLTLGWRTGIVVALSVPLVLAIVMVVMQMTGMNLDRITLGALIVALGLLVDDAIIAVEMMQVKLEEGYDRMRAAVHAWSSTAFPMLTGTLITAAGFLPVGFAKSSAGEYAGGIFWVVGIALIASWFVAVLFTPFLGFSLLPEVKSTQHHAPYQSRLYRALRWFITLCVRRPRTVVSLTLVLFVLSIVGFTFVPQQFFPQSSRPELLVELRLPEGSSITATSAEVAKVEKLLQDDADVAHFTAYVGAGAPRFYLALNPDLPNPSFAKFVILTQGPESRERLRQRLLDTFADDTTFALPRGRVLRLEFGPPTGFPVQFRVTGPDPIVVRELASQVRDVMRQHSKTRDVQLDYGEPGKTVRLQLDQDRLRLLNLTPQDAAEALHTLVSGFPVTQYRERTELIDVVARAIPEERLGLGGLPDLTLPVRGGQAIPLTQVGTLSYELEAPIVRRRNRETVLTVKADVHEGVQGPDVTAALLPQLEALKQKLPPGYRVTAGGAREESEKANIALYRLFPIMILTMLLLLMAQVQNFRIALLVFVICPLGLIGAVGGLLLFHAPFGFVALLGVISLAGMDMRNSVILIDQIQQDRTRGMSEWEAVIESSVRRARPVILTAGTAILAMIPLTRSVFWGPMAVAIMGGLSIATFLTLINLPALYVLLFRVRPSEASQSVTG